MILMLSVACVGGIVYHNNARWMQNQHLSRTDRQPQRISYITKFLCSKSQVVEICYASVPYFILKSTVNVHCPIHYATLGSQ